MSKKALHQASSVQPQKSFEVLERQANDLVQNMRTWKRSGGSILQQQFVEEEPEDMESDSDNESEDSESNYKPRRELDHEDYENSDSDGGQEMMSETDPPLGGKLKGLKKPITNDDLFYDPKKDDRDEEWIRKERLKYIPVCFDCQQHDEYEGQYRTMFPRECEVMKSEPVSFDGSMHHPGDAKYYKVTCKECQSVLGLEDEEGITHFFSVFATDANY